MPESSITPRLKATLTRALQSLRQWNGMLAFIALILVGTSFILDQYLFLGLALTLALLLLLHQAGALALLFQKLEVLQDTKLQPAPTLPMPAKPAKQAGSSATIEKTRPLPNPLSEWIRSNRLPLPCVTIVVPLFNEERFIADCIQSVLSQSWENWRCIIVNDASTDNSPRIAQSFAATEGRVTVVTHTRNSGLSASRNTGLRLADTKYVTFLDADDLLLKDSLRMRMSLLSALTDDLHLAGVYCGIKQVPEETPVTFVPKDITFARTTADFVNTQAECPFNAHAPILLTDVVRQAGGFSESMLHGAEDWHLWQRIMRAGYYFKSVPKVGALYRQKRNSMVRSMSVEHIDEASKIYSAAQQSFAAYSFTSDTRPFSEPIATYTTTVMFVRRLVPFAAMAYVHGGDEALTDILSRMPPAAGKYLTRHLNPKALALVGIDRALALTGDSARAVSTEREILASHVEEKVMSKLHDLDDKSPVHRAPNPTSRYLFYVVDAYEGMLVREISALLTHEDFAVVCPDQINGNQGAFEFLLDAGLPVRSVNELTLAPTPASVICFFRRSGFGVHDLTVWAAGLGIKTVYFEPPISIDPTPVTSLDSASFDQEMGSHASFNELKTSTEAVSLGTKFVTENPRFIYPHKSLALEERLDLAPDCDKLLQFKNKHEGERCIIVGNGPSLNEMDLSLIKDEYTFAVNGIFYKSNETGFMPTYYVVEDSSVMRENQAQIREYPAPNKFFPTLYKSMHPEADNVAFFRMNRGFYEKSGPNFCVPRFSTDFAQRAYCGQSVTFINLQLAYYMGFSEVYLIGMDFSYVIPESAIVEGDIITSTEDDPNHFNGAYFGKGKTWKDPKLDRVLQNYQMAKRMYEARGSKIFNATLGGKLEAFDRVSYTSIFR